MCYNKLDSNVSGLLLGRDDTSEDEPLPASRDRLSRFAPLLLVVTMPLLSLARDESALPGWKSFVAPKLAGGGSGSIFFPGRYSEHTLLEVLDPSGYEVHLTRADDPGAESVHPAGELFPPPGGRWRVWLQGEWSITPFSSLVVFPASRRAGVAPAIMPVAPAGKVALPEDLAIRSDRDLWLLAAEERSGVPRHELSRRRSLSEVGDGVLMPSGLVLAGVWDRREKRYSAFSRPFHLPARSTAPAPLERPDAAESWLVSYVEHPRLSAEPLSGFELTVTVDGEERPADFMMRTSWGVHAVWYGLAPGRTILGGGNDILYLEPQTLELHGGEIARFEGALLDRPFLDIGLVLPRVLREEPLALAVRQPADGTDLARVDLSRQAGRHRFDSLIHGVVEVVLETHVGPFRRQVELIGDENFITLEPELIEVFGTVHRGGEPHPATVSFETVTGDSIEATTDEGGGYHAFALHPLRWVTVQLDSVDQEPWRELFAPAIERTQELDFDISAAEVTVHVIDARTGEAIDGAVVRARNKYRAPVAAEGEGDTESGRGERAIAGSHSADVSGIVRLPPPRPGRLELRAEAEGYRPMRQPQVVEIQDPPQDRTLTILLEPLGDTVRIRLLLPDGTPAAGAEVMRVQALTELRPLSLDRADAEGVVEVPMAPAEGLLLLRHSRAAFGIVDWASWTDEEHVVWTFSPAAGSALSLRVSDPSGEAPAAGASISLWLAGRELAGMALHWLLDARPTTDRNGFWTAERLPAGPVRVLARMRRDEAGIGTGAFETLAVDVPYPWPPMVDVRAVW